jgi:hypothetical protein
LCSVAVSIDIKRNNRYTKMKLIDLTPAKFLCGKMNCPAVFQLDEKNFVIIGKIFSEGDPTLRDRIGAGDVAIEISAELLKGALALAAQRP